MNFSDVKSVSHGALVAHELSTSVFQFLRETLDEEDATDVALTEIAQDMNQSANAQFTCR